MEIRTSTVAVVAASCITVGAAGAFLATRPSNSTPQPSAQLTEVPAGTVEQSEGVIADAPVDAAPVDAAPAPTLPRALAPSVTPPSKPRVDAPRPASGSVRTAPARVQSPASREITPPAPADSRSTESRAIATAPTAPASIDTRVAQPKPIPPTVAEPVASVAPPEPRYLDLVVAQDSVLGLQVETSISSDKARVEDEVVARVTRDVRVGDRVAIPAGATARGEVTMVERGGKVRDRARLGIRFTSVVLADGTRVPLETETIYREGDSPTGESAAKIGGGAIGGAIIGGIFGGVKGAAIGASAGAGAGTAAVMAGGRNPATLPSGTPVTVRVVKPATVTVEE
jgi:hypothetical protein